MYTFSMNEEVWNVSNVWILHENWGFFLFKVHNLSTHAYKSSLSVCFSDDAINMCTILSAFFYMNHQITCTYYLACYEKEYNINCLNYINCDTCTLYCLVNWLMFCFITLFSDTIILRTVNLYWFINGAVNWM